MKVLEKMELEMNNDKFFNNIIDYIENMPMEEFENLVGQLDNLPCPFAIEDEKL